MNNDFMTKEILEKLKTYVSVPESMDDHWIVRPEDGESLWIRSWTKKLAFAVDLETGDIRIGDAFNPDWSEEERMIWIKGFFSSFSC